MKKTAVATKATCNLGFTKFTDKEMLDNVAYYIRDRVGTQNWQEQIMNISSYIAAAINRREVEVVDYLSTKLSFMRGRKY